MGCFYGNMLHQYSCLIAYSALSLPCPSLAVGPAVAGFTPGEVVAFLGEVDANGVGGALAMAGRVGGSLVAVGTGEARVGVSLEKGSLGACLEGMLGTPGRWVSNGRGVGSFLIPGASGDAPMEGRGAADGPPIPPLIGGSGLVISNGGEADVAVSPSVPSPSPPVVAGVINFFGNGLPPSGPLPLSSGMEVKGVRRRGIIAPGRGCCVPEAPGSLPRARPA